MRTLTRAIGVGIAVMALAGSGVAHAGTDSTDQVVDPTPDDSVVDSDDVEGISVGVAPTSFGFSETFRGDEYVRSLLLTNAGGADRQFIFTPSGDIAEWITVSSVDGQVTDTLVVNADSETSVVIQIDVPDDAPNGTFQGDIDVGTAPVGDGLGASSGDDLSIGARVPVTVTVVGDARLGGTFDSLIIEPAEVGMPMLIQAMFDNTGNVSYNPDLTYTITRDGQPVDVIDLPGAGTVNAGLSMPINYQWDTTDTLPGEYRIEAVATAEGYAFEPITRTFRIEPPGSVERAGRLESLALVNAPVEGGLAQIRGVFRNDSSIPVGAVLITEVSLDGNLVDEVRSIELLARPNGETDIDVSLLDVAAGEYSVSGVVNFEGRETETLTASFTVGAPVDEPTATVGGDDSNGINLTMILVIVGVVLAALAVLYFVLRHRRSDEDDPPSRPGPTTDPFDIVLTPRGDARHIAVGANVGQSRDSN